MPRYRVVVRTREVDKDGNAIFGNTNVPDPPDVFIEASSSLLAICIWSKTMLEAVEVTLLSALKRGLQQKDTLQ